LFEEKKIKSGRDAKEGWVGGGLGAQVRSQGRSSVEKEILCGGGVKKRTARGSHNIVKSDPKKKRAKSSQGGGTP